MPAERVSIPSGTLRAQMMPGMKVTETLKPVSIQKMGDKYIMDTGQNLAGGYVSASKVRQATAFVFILQNVWNQMEKSSRKICATHIVRIYM